MGAHRERDGRHVAVGLDVGRNRPQHVRIVVDVDLVVDHDGDLDVGIAGERRHAGRLPLARHPLLDLDVGGEGAVARRRQVHPGDRGDQLGDRIVERGLEGQRAGQVVLPVRRVEIVVDRVAPHGDPRHLHQADRVLGGSVEPGVFGERAVGGLLRRVEEALDGDLGPGRDRDVDGLARHHLERLAHQRAHHLVFVGIEGLLRQRAQDRGRVVADEQHRVHRLIHLAVLAVDVARVVGRVEHAGELVPSLDLVAVDAGVEHPGLGVLHHQATDGDVLARVFHRVLDDGELAEIDFVLADDDLLDRRVLARDLLGGDRLRHALAETVEDLRLRPVGIDAEREAEKLVLAEQVGDQRQLRAVDLLEADDRIVVARGELLLDHAGLVDRIDRAADGLEILRPHLPGLGEEGSEVLVHRVFPQGIRTVEPVVARASSARCASAASASGHSWLTATVTMPRSTRSNRRPAAVSIISRVAM